MSITLNLVIYQLINFSIDKNSVHQLIFQLIDISFKYFQDFNMNVMRSPYI